MTPTTLLLRQIHPSFVKQGRVTSQAFRPTPKDERKLSVYDGDLISPSASWLHFRSRNLESVGVMGVAVEDCTKEELVVRSSPQHFPEHAEIDFRDFTSTACETKSKRLRSLAEDRGWLYRAEDV
jgi:hypothetical protein